MVVYRTRPVLPTLLLTAILVFPSDLNGQPMEQWVAVYGGGGIEDASALAVDELGNVYVTGVSRCPETKDDYATIKYDPSGVLQWEALYDADSSFDQAYALAIDRSGNVYVTGYSISTGENHDFATIKYSGSGVQQWVVRYNGPGNSDDDAQALAVDAEGNVYVTGSSTGLGTLADFTTIKYNGSGVQQWFARYNGTGNSGDYAQALAVDATGNVYVTGYSMDPSSSNDYATIKYDASGVEEWVARYDQGEDHDYAEAIAVDAAGNVYVTGGSMTEFTGHDYATIKYDPSGTLQWVRRYDGIPFNELWDFASALAVDAEGNVYVTGYSERSFLNSDYATIKYNNAGDEEWVVRYNGPANGQDFASALAIDGTGNVYVAGGSEGDGEAEDYVTIKYDTQGQEQWVVRYDGSGNLSDAAVDIAVDESENVYVTGQSSSSSFDITTIKYGYDRTLGVGDSEVSPHDFILSQNYPNPFNPTTAIGFQIAEEGFVTLKIVDLLGSEIATLVNEDLDAGSHSREWNAAGVSSGVYIYTLSTAGYTQTRKLIFLR